MSYLDIMNDEIIIKEFNKIDEYHNNRFNHGKRHAKNAIDNILKLSDMLKIDETEQNYLCVACALYV